MPSTAAAMFGSLTERSTEGDIFLAADTFRNWLLRIAGNGIIDAFSLSPLRLHSIGLATSGSASAGWR